MLHIASLWHFPLSLPKPTFDFIATPSVLSEGRAMSQSILVASRDDLLLHTRCAILKCAGYRTVSTDNLAQAILLSLDLSPNLIILGHSFSEGEQTSFIEKLHESQPDTCVLCLKFGLIDPTMLLTECKAILSGQPGCARVRSLRAN